MSNIDKRALREAAERAESDSWGYDRDEFNEALTPAAVLALLDELEAAKSYAKERDEENQDLMLTVGRLRVEKEAAERRIAKLSASHGKLREAMAGIHNIIRGEGAYTPLAAILNASKRAYEESAAAAGKGE